MQRSGVTSTISSQRIRALQTMANRLRRHSLMCTNKGWGATGTLSLATIWELAQ